MGRRRAAEPRGGSTPRRGSDRLQVARDAGAPRAVASRPSPRETLSRASPTHSPIPRSATPSTRSTTARRTPLPARTSDAVVDTASITSATSAPAPARIPSPPSPPAPVSSPVDEPIQPRRPGPSPTSRGGQTNPGGSRRVVWRDEDPDTDDGSLRECALEDVREVYPHPTRDPGRRERRNPRARDSRATMTIRARRKESRTDGTENRGARGADTLRGDTATGPASGARRGFYGMTSTATAISSRRNREIGEDAVDAARILIRVVEFRPEGRG